MMDYFYKVSIKTLKFQESVKGKRSHHCWLLAKNKVGFYSKAIKIKWMFCKWCILASDLTFEGSYFWLLLVFLWLLKRRSLFSKPLRLFHFNLAPMRTNCDCVEVWQQEGVCGNRVYKLGHFSVVTERLIITQINASLCTESVLWTQQG